MLYQGYNVYRSDKNKNLDQNKKKKQKSKVTDLNFGRKWPRFAQSGLHKRQPLTTTQKWLLGVVFVLVMSPLLSVVYTYTRVGGTAHVHAATASTLNFQARLMGSNGALVADGSYSIEFKLYTAASAGTNEWTETQSVAVKNGYFSANLGIVTPFGASIDWSQEKWLTMNINADGEMTPRIKLTAVPYAFRAGQADTLTITGGTVTGDNLWQKAPASVQSLSSTVAGLRMNQTGTGGLLQLQRNGTNQLTIGNTGDLVTTGIIDINGASLNIGSSTLAGNLILEDGAGRTGTFVLGGLTGNRTYTMPDASGTVCLTTTCSGAADGFINGGNLFGTNSTLGNNDGFSLSFETSGTNRMTILPNGDIGVGVAAPTGTFEVQGAAGTSSGATVMTAVSGISTFTTSASVTLNAGDYIIPTTTTAQARVITVGGTGVSFTVSPAYTANVTLETYTVYRPITRLKNDAGNTALFVEGSTGNVGIGTAAPLSLFSVGATSQFRVDGSGNSTAASLSLSSGDLIINGTTVLTNARVLQNVSANASIITAGTLGVVRGGTGIDASAAANGTLLIGNGSGYTLAGLSNNGGVAITNGAGSIGLAVSYGSAANTAAQGNSSLSFTGGGNLTGTVSGTAGGGFTSNTLSIIDNPTFATSVTTPLLASSSGLSITSGGAGNISFNSASNIIVLDGTETTLRRVASGSYGLELNDTAATSFTINNTGAGAASLNLIDGDFLTNSISRLTNSGALQNIGGYTQSTGDFGIAGTGTFATGTGAVGLNGATTISTSTNSAVALTVNGTSGTAATALQIAQTGNAANLELSNTARTSGALVSLTHNTSAFTGTGLLFNIASGSGSFASGNFLDFQLNGASRFRVDNTGALQISSDSATALQVLSANGSTSFFTVNDTGNLVQIGSSTGDGISILLILDSGTSDPGGVNGGSYYNSTDNKNRCFEGGVWTDCATTVVVGETTLGTANATISVALNRNVEYLRCRVDIKGRSANSTPWLRFNSDSGAAAYGWNLYGIVAAAVIDAQDSSDSEMELTSAGSTAPFSANVDITNFSDTRKAVEWSSVVAEAIGSNMGRMSGGGIWSNASTQITSVQFVASAGTFSSGSHAWCEGRNVR